MTTIHTLHTTIQFPTEPGDDLLPDLESVESLWPNLWPQTATWMAVEERYPMLHPLPRYADDALYEEGRFRVRYIQARAYHRAGQSVLAAHWTSLTITSVIAAISTWMDVAGMLSATERETPERAESVRPLLHAVGTEQQRLLTLLAILQAIYFSYCQRQQVPPRVLPLPDESDDEASVVPTVQLSPADQIEVREVQR